METVLVTGGCGASGRWVVDRLAGDYEVVVVDYERPGLDASPIPNVSFRAADLANRGEALDVVHAVNPDAVVHWAAIPVAGTHPDGRVFETNVRAAKNVLDAAGRTDARIVQASSDGAYGFFFADPTPMPDELPVTEEHPLRPEDPYGLSKVTAEAVAGAVARREGVPAVSIRP
ncbi:NAD-dependent epimerase/dehydratase family protein, partial [Halorubrum trueperi]